MAKVNCWECGGNKTASSGPYNGRWYEHCHRCGATRSEEWAPSLHQGPHAAFSGVVKGNHPTAPDGEPTEAMLAWLGRYGVSWATFERWGGRREAGRLAFHCDSFCSSRSVDPNVKPKWLTKVKSPMSVNLGQGWGWGDKATNHVVIVEDSLAAIKAAEAGAWGFPMLGTSTTNVPFQRFQGRKVLVLTDPDDAGIIAGMRLMWGLRGTGARMYSTKEPKEYSYEELKQFLEV